jgi:uncharacterized protein YbjT (DUF2867 family)
MIIATTAPTGTVGSKVASFLVNMKGIQVSLLTRSREKVKHLEEFGALVYEGDLEDSHFVSRATATADALFWITPTPPTTNDLRGFQNRLGANAAKAVVTNAIGRVVNLSSMGAHIGYDTGPIDGLHDVEQHLNEAAAGSGAKTTHLRPALFMENYLRFAYPIVKDRTVPIPVAGARSVPMIATGDVAVEAVRHLAFPSNGCAPTQPLHGPRDVVLDDAAQTIGEAIEQPVTHLKTDPELTRTALKAAGLSDEVALRIVTMYQSIDSGHLQPEHERSDHTTTPTSFREFCKSVLVPELRRVARL